MKSAWRSAVVSERYAVPVEMRFIDMFMAALGALVFMSMLLAFVLKYLPPPDAAPRALPPRAMPGSLAEPLELLTKSLPPARVGEAYEIALAHRGGTGPVRWHIAAGAAEMPAGLRFDDTQGVVHGVPTSVQIGRFVVVVQDGARGMKERPYTLTVEAPLAPTSSFIAKLAACGLIGLVLLVALLSFGSARQLARQVGLLEAASKRGQPAVQWETGPGVFETIELPGGIATYRMRQHFSRRLGWGLLFLGIVTAIFFVWRLWLI